jgi:SAM-dependent methyltransferase
MTALDAFREDLNWQAQRGLELGRELCACEARHHWSYAILRVAGSTSSIGSEEAVVGPLIAPIVRDETRLLIGGSADTGLLCFVGRCAAPRRPNITVIDRCKAPLALIDEFAANRGIKCRTRLADLLALDGHEQWDVILLHHTAEFFSGPSRTRFFDAIARSLAPGGRLVCVTMTGRKLAPEKQVELEDEFRDHSMAALRRSPLAGYQQSSEIEQLIGDFAKVRAIRRMTFPDHNEMYDDFRKAGLQIVSEREMPKKSTFSKVDSAPGAVRKFVIVATRD